MNKSKDRIKRVTIRCRFSVQCGKHEKFVYVCSTDAAFTDEVFRMDPMHAASYLEHATREMLETLPEASIEGEGLRLGLMNAAMEVMYRDESDKAKPCQ